MISRQLERDLLSKPDSPALPPKNGCETGLFLIEHGSKSIFWYWEIDSVGRTYRDFRSPDLERGMEAFLVEDWQFPDLPDDVVDTDA
jgi:hypothetical protein